MMHKTNTIEIKIIIKYAPVVLQIVLSFFLNMELSKLMWILKIAVHSILPRYETIVY